MLELPHTMRELLVEQLDEFCESLDDTSDTDAIAEAVVETIETVGQETAGVDAEEIISQLESSGELEASLIEVIEEELASAEDFEYTGEELVALLERICEIEWLDDEEEEEAASFFGDGAGVDEDD